MAHDEWYTPAEIIEPIRKFYGGRIDLDPATCGKANSNIVKAWHTYTINYSGLDKTWSGNVWVNPPYCGKDTVKKWIDKANSSLVSNQIVMLVNRSDAKWYYKFLDNHKGAYYQFRNRIKFIDGITGKKSSPRYNNDLIYWGNNPSGFMDMCVNSYGKPVPHSF
jgi:DNA N-6-adenine-methyltransferase (Dam)